MATDSAGRPLQAKAFRTRALRTQALCVQLCLPLTLPCSSLDLALEKTCYALCVFCVNLKGRYRKLSFASLKQWQLICRLLLTLRQQFIVHAGK